jgi:hypothetical protein
MGEEEEEYYEELVRLDAIHQAGIAAQLTHRYRRSTRTTRLSSTRLLPQEERAVISPT